MDLDSINNLKQTMENYLKGLNYEKCEDWDSRLKGLYVARKNNGAYYYFSTYKNFKKHKQTFFDILESVQKEIKKDWDLHHIVEKNHLQVFYKEATVDNLYENSWPCVLIHKEEHKAYNSMFRSKEAKILYADTNQPKTPLLGKIKTMYSEVYTDNNFLATIAKNVLAKVNS